MSILTVLGGISHLRAWKRVVGRRVVSLALKILVSVVIARHLLVRRCLVGRAGGRRFEHRLLLSGWSLHRRRPVLRKHPVESSLLSRLVNFVLKSLLWARLFPLFLDQRRTWFFRSGLFLLWLFSNALSKAVGDRVARDGKSRVWLVERVLLVYLLLNELAQG